MPYRIFMYFGTEYNRRLENVIISKIKTEYPKEKL